MSWGLSYYLRGRRVAQVVKLSDAVQELPRSVTEFVHGVPESFLKVGEAKAKVPKDGGQRFSKGAYFIGKVRRPVTRQNAQISEAGACCMTADTIVLFPLASSSFHTLPSSTVHHMLPLLCILKCSHAGRNCCGHLLMHSVCGAGHLGEGLYRAAGPGGEGPRHQRDAHRH